jgi:dihydropyrimidinase
MYGLYPRKGSIAPGADADLVIWDTDADITLDNAMLHHNVDYTPYAGMHLKAWPKTVLSRGEVVVDGGELKASAGRGQFLKSASPATVQPMNIQYV